MWDTYYINTFSFIVFILEITFSIFLIYLLVKKYKLSKQQLMIFTFMVILWVGIKLIDPIRGTYATELADQSIGNSLSLWYIIAITGGYGFISIIVRYPNSYFGNRYSLNLFIWRASLYLVTFSILIVAFATLFVSYQVPETGDPYFTGAVKFLGISLIISSMGLGLAASTLSTSHQMFNATMGGGNKAGFASVSILSMPPLIAEFIVAPMQSLAKQASGQNPLAYSWLWLIAGIFIIASIIYSFFLKPYYIIPSQNVKGKFLGIVNYSYPTEKHIHEFTKEERKENYRHGKWWLWTLLGISFVGFFIALSRFMTTGSNGQLMLNFYLDEHGYTGFVGDQMYGYFSSFHAFFMLLGGVSAGTFFVKKERLGGFWTFIIGMLFMLSYSIINIANGYTIHSPIILFISYGLMGFGYGLTYHLLFSLVLKWADNTQYKGIYAFGIYQMIFSLGLAIGQLITPIIAIYGSPASTSLDEIGFIFMISTIGLIFTTILFASMYKIIKRFDILDKLDYDVNDLQDE